VTIYGVELSRQVKKNCKKAKNKHHDIRKTGMVYATAFIKCKKVMIFTALIFSKLEYGI
jgi:hypothetical protein